MTFGEFGLEHIVPLVAIPVLFLIGLSCGSVPVLFKLTKKNKMIFGIANAFSGGIFIGSGLLHMLPDANEMFSDIHSLPDYPIANLIAATGFCATLFLELVLSPGHEADILLNTNHGTAPESSDSEERTKPKIKTHSHADHPVFVPRVSSPMILPIQLRQNSANAKRSAPIHPTQGKEISPILNLMNKPQNKPQNSLNASLLSASPRAVEAYSINKSPSLLCIDLERKGIQNSSNRQLNIANNPLFNQVIASRSRNNSPQITYTPRGTLVRRRSFSEVDGNLTPTGSKTNLLDHEDIERLTLPRRRSFNEPIDTFRVRYYSRLFESGFNTAITLIKQINSDITNLPQLVHETHLYNEGGTDEIETDLGIHNIEFKDPSTIAAFIFLLVLSIHSVITGMAVGGNDDDRREQWYLLIALVIHKAMASMALGISVKKASFTIKFSLYLMAGFACSTPIGVGLGFMLAESVRGESHNILIASLTAFGSGTFLYLAMFENLTEEFIESHKHLMPKWFAVISGIVIMAVLAIFS